MQASKQWPSARALPCKPPRRFAIVPGTRCWLKKEDSDDRYRVYVESEIMDDPNVYLQASKLPTVQFAET